jgi:hypothetical protein
MKREFKAGLAALAIIGSAAHASATADVSFGDGIGISAGPIAGGTYVTDGWTSPTLGYQETYTFTITYTINLAADGLAVTRDWMFCTPSFPDYCGRAPTGRESAEVYLMWGGMDSRGNPGVDNLSFTYTPDQDFYLSSGSHTYAGVMTLSVTNNDYFPTAFSPVLLAGVFVDSSAASPAPEPAPSGLLLAGGALLFAVRRSGRA